MAPASAAPVQWPNLAAMARIWGTVLLDDVKVNAMERVDAQAEIEFLRYVATGSGQALVYEAKRREAEVWAAATSPHPSPTIPSCAAAPRG